MLGEAHGELTMKSPTLLALLLPLEPSMADGALTFVLRVAGDDGARHDEPFYALELRVCAHASDPPSEQHDRLKPGYAPFHSTPETHC